MKSMRLVWKLPTNYQINTMNKKEMNGYVLDRIENKLYSKIHHYEYEANYYFKNRHKGLAGVDDEQVFGLAFDAIRNLRVWREMEWLCKTESKL